MAAHTPPKPPRPPFDPSQPPPITPPPFKAAASPREGTTNHGHATCVDGPAHVLRSPYAAVVGSNPQVEDGVGALSTGGGGAQETTLRRRLPRVRRVRQQGPQRPSRTSRRRRNRRCPPQRRCPHTQSGWAWCLEKTRHCCGWRNRACAPPCPRHGASCATTAAPPSTSTPRPTRACGSTRSKR